MESTSTPATPSRVLIAVTMLYVGVTITAGGWLMGRAPADHPFGPAELVTLRIFGPVSFLNFLVYYMIGKGKNWARIVFLILMGAGVPLWIASMVQFLGRTSFAISLEVGVIALSFAVFILEIIALVLLFQRDSSHWFKLVIALSGNSPENRGEGMH